MLAASSLVFLLLATPSVEIPAGGPIELDGYVQKAEWETATTIHADKVDLHLRRQGAWLAVGIEARQTYRGEVLVLEMSDPDGAWMTGFVAALGQPDSPPALSFRGNPDVVRRAMQSSKVILRNPRGVRARVRVDEEGKWSAEYLIRLSVLGIGRGDARQLLFRANISVRDRLGKPLLAVPALGEDAVVLHSPDGWGKTESWSPISPEASKEFDDHALLWRLHVEHNQEAAREETELLVIRTAVHPRSMRKINSLRREIEAGQKRNPTLPAWRYFLARLLHEANLYEESAPMIAAIPKSLRGLDPFVHLVAESALDFEKPQIVRDLYKEFPGAPSRAEMIQNAAILEGMLESERAVTKSAAADKDPNPIARMTLKKGVVEFELFEDDAPHTVHNFVSLVIRQQYYDGLRFRPVVAGTTARLGDPRTRAGARGGANGPLWRVKLDKVKRAPLAGRLMAVPVQGGVTHGSQFAFALSPVYLAPDKFVVFGRVVKGMDVLLQLEEDDLVEKIEIIRKRNHNYDPIASRLK